MWFSRMVLMLNLFCGMQICREQFVSLHSQPVLSNLSQSLLDRYGYAASDIRYAFVTYGRSPYTQLPLTSFKHIFA